MVQRDKDIPPLTSLRTFEAVVRHGSFIAAADHLGLTQAAISYQIKALEAHLRIPLFQRHGRQMVLTPDGRAYGQSILRAFTDIARASGIFKTRSAVQIARIGIAPSFATMADIADSDTLKYGKAKWDIQLEVRDADVDFETETIDAAIHGGYPLRSGLVSHRLFRSRIVALAAKQLWDRHAPIRGPRDLLKMPLIEFGKTNDGWRRWFSQIDPTIEAPLPRLRSDTLATGVQMAEAGLGVILGPLPLVSRHVKSKRLVDRLSVSVESRMRDYYLVYREIDESSAKIKAIRKWVDETASRLQEGARSK